MIIRSLLVLFIGATTVATLFSTSTACAQDIDRETVAGGVVGAIIGGIVGKQNDETPEGVAIGGVAGAIAGNLLGKAKDRSVVQQRYQYQQRVRQQRQLRQQQEIIQQQQLSRAISIDDAISLSRAGVGEQLILNQIQANGVSQEIGVQEIIAMSQNGVTECVIEAMQKSSIGSGVAIASAPVIIDQGPVVVSRPAIEVQSSPTYVDQRYRQSGYYGVPHNARSRQHGGTIHFTR